MAILVACVKSFFVGAFFMGLKWEKTNLIFVTHYVVISEILDYPTSSGEIVITNKKLKIIDTLEIEY